MRAGTIHLSNPVSILDDPAKDAVVIELADVTKRFGNIEAVRLVPLVIFTSIPEQFPDPDRADAHLTTDLRLRDPHD